MTGNHRAPSLKQPSTPEEAAAHYYLWVTVFVTAGLVGGATLQWLPTEPSPWRWAFFALAYAVGGYRIAVDTWQSLRAGRLSIDFLMGAAALGAAAVGNPLEGVILIFLFSLSNTLEAFALGRTRRAVDGLLDLRPTYASLVDEEGVEVRRIPAEELAPGHRILVRPGERVAADGRVESGRSEVDQSAITGESVPVGKARGDEVFAGTFNDAGSLVVRVTREPDETMLARIVRLVRQARERRAPAQHFIDRFAHPYTVGVVAVTALAALVPPLGFQVPWSDALYRAITLLVVASPCALIISTPAAILSGIANGARNGILFKGGAHLDGAGGVDAVAFDKTGTLTEGRPRLVDLATTRTGAALHDRGDPDRAGWKGRVHEEESSSEAEKVEVRELDAPEYAGRELEGRALEMDEEELLRLAAAVEGHSEHHLAKAVARAAGRLNPRPSPAGAFHAFPGEGVQGEVDGRKVWVGNRVMAGRCQATPDEGLERWRAEQSALGHSVTYVGTDGEVLGALAFGDVLKPHVAETIERLKAGGVKWVTVLSGDHPATVEAVARQLPVDEILAGLLPDEKVAAVRELRNRSWTVAMVGDGVNDAPAMATSDLGVAMGAAGTDVAIETADVVLMSDEVPQVSYLLHLGRRTRRVVRQNVWFSVGWMAALVIAAGTVGIPLTLAVVAHEGSTLLVVLNGLRLLRGAQSVSGTS